MGLAILESYSRIIESLAFTVLSRIEDVMHVDSLAINPSSAEQKRFPSPIMRSEKTPIAKEDNSAETPTSKTLLDFMGWNIDNGETETNKDTQDEVEANHLSKPPSIVTNKKLTYIERLENLGGTKSPTARH